MLEFQLDETTGIAELKPHGALKSEDFTALGTVVDRYIGLKGVLPGLLINTASFPGWESFEAFRTHMLFIEEHHMKVARVAIVSDSTLLWLLPKIADFFLQSEVRLFHSRNEALGWLMP